MHTGQRIAPCGCFGGNVRLGAVPCAQPASIVEQDHRGIKSRTGPMLGFQLFNNAATAIAGIELIRRIKKGPVQARPVCSAAQDRSTNLGRGSRRVMQLAAHFTTISRRVSRFAPEPERALDRVDAFDSATFDATGYSDSATGPLTARSAWARAHWYGAR